MADGTQAHGLEIAGRTIGFDDADYQEVVKFLTVPASRQGEAAFNGTDRAAITKLEDPVRHQIVAAMTEARTPSVFPDLAAAQADIVLRSVAISTMTRLNTGAYDADYFDPIQKIVPRIGGTFFDDQRSGHGIWKVDSYWAPADIGDGWNADWLVKDGASPSGALDPTIIYRLFPFRGECAGALQISVYLGAIAAIGPSAFDAQQNAPVRVGAWADSSVRLYMQKVPLDDQPIPGDYLYFRNDKDYLKYAPNGFWQGLNCLYVGADMFGVRRYSGLGAVWQSEPELRQALKNAFYGDCYPHSIPDPKTDIVFTERARLVIATTREGATMPGDAPGLTPTGPGGLTPERLKDAGFVEAGHDVWEHPEIELGTLSRALGFERSRMVQTISAPAFNPSYRVDVEGTLCIIDYHDPDAPRHAADTKVRAFVRLA